MPRTKSTLVGTAIAVVAALTALSASPAHSASGRPSDKATTPATSVNNGSPIPNGTAPAKVTGPPADHILSGPQPDILWYNTSLDQLQIWYMDDRRVIGRQTVVGPDGSPTGARHPGRSPARQTSTATEPRTSSRTSPTAVRP